VQPSESLTSSIPPLVDRGKAVVTADESSIIGMMLHALNTGRSATFYVSPEQARAVMRLYWTSPRVKALGMQRVSDEERARIESELGVKDMGPMFSNRLECACGGVYGAYEFIEQGLQEHGKDWIGAIVALENTAVLRINPTQDAVCPSCRQLMLETHLYEMYTDSGKLLYGCCRGEIPGPILAFI
jgi:hypothetical protein